MYSFAIHFITMVVGINLSIPFQSSFNALGSEQTPSVHKLKLASFARVSSPGVKRFDLSGMDFSSKGTLYLVNDKSSAIFEVPSTIQGDVEAKSVFDISDKIKGIDDFDFEAIRPAIGDGYWLSSEKISKVIHWNPDQKSAHYVFEETAPKLNEMGMNPKFGMEALCTYEKGSTRSLILGKEKEPVRFLKVNMNESKKRQMDFMEMDPTFRNIDVTDCKQQGTKLFFLNRDHFRIFSVEEERSAFVVKEIWDFSEVQKDPRFNYWTKDQVTGVQHDEWGLAEALTLDDGFVYVGFDNNGQSLKANDQETRPVILKFKRP